MLLDNVFKPFIEEKPICVMARAVLQRILDPHHLDQLFPAPLNASTPTSCCFPHSWT